MNRLALVPARREPPFYNLGAPGVDHYLDLEIDGERLYRLVEAAVGEHDDVIGPLTPEVPGEGLAVVDALLGANDQLWKTYDAREGEIPIYVCPIDYDLLCGAFVARVRRSPETVTLDSFRYVSTDDEAMRDITGKLVNLRFRFARPQFDDVLRVARAELVVAAETVSPARRASESPRGGIRRWMKRKRV